MILCALRTEFFLLLVLLAVGGLIGWFTTARATEKAAPYQVVSADLEPFRSAFNGASADVRVVLLVGPT